MMLSGNGNVITDDVPDYLKAGEEITPYEKLLPMLIAAVLSFILVRK